MTDAPSNWQEHPKAFEEAKRYEKNAIEHGSPFTWSHRESLAELEQPERMEAIKTDYLRRLERAKAGRRANPLRESNDVGLDVDDVYGVDEGGGSCLACHK